MNKIKLLVMISGGGTTLANFLDVKAKGGLLADVVCVISSKRKDSGNSEIIERCESEQIPVHYIVRSEFNSKEEFWAAQDEIVNQYSPDLITLAGYLKLWRIPENYLGRVMNIHPALLPKFGGKGFYGMHVHETVLNSGEKESGCTVHFANNEYDSGPIILQKFVKITPEDTAKSIKDRVFEQECIAYPEAINLFAQNKLEIIGDVNSGTVKIAE